MTNRTKIILTGVVAFSPIVVFGMASLATFTPFFALIWAIWSMIVVLVALGYHLIFCKQQAIKAIPHHYASIPPVQREAVQEAREYEPIYEPIIVSYPMLRPTNDLHY